MINLFLDYAARLNNLLLIFSVLGAIAIFLIRQKKIPEYFLLFTLFLSTPFYIDREYFIPNFLIINTIIGVYFVDSLKVFRDKSVKFYLVLFFSFIFILSFIFTSYQLHINNEPSEEKYANPDNVALSDEWIVDHTISSSLWHREFIAAERTSFSSDVVEMQLCPSSTCSTLSDSSLFFTLESFAGSLDIIEYPFLESLRGDSYYIGGNIERNGDTYEPNSYQIRFRLSPEAYYDFMNTIGLEYLVVSLKVDPVTLESDKQTIIGIWSSENFYTIYNNGHERMSKV